MASSRKGAAPKLPEGAQRLKKKGNQRPPTPTFWSENGSFNAQRAGRWKVIEIDEIDKVRAGKRRCAKLTLELDSFDDDWGAIITHATTLSVNDLRGADWASPEFQILQKSRQGAGDPSSTEQEEEGSSDDEAARKPRSRVARMPAQASSSEDSSDNEGSKKPAARALRPKRKPGRPSKKSSPPPRRGRGRPRKAPAPRCASSATESSDDEEIVARKPAAKGRGRRKQAPAKPRGGSSTRHAAAAPPSQKKQSASTNRASDKPLEDCSPREVVELLSDKADELSAQLREKSGQRFRNLASALEERPIDGSVFAKELESGDVAFLKFMNDTLGLEGGNTFLFSVMLTFKKAM